MWIPNENRSLQLLQTQALLLRSYFVVGAKIRNFNLNLLWKKRENCLCRRCIFMNLFINICPQCPLKSVFWFDFGLYQVMIRCRCADWAKPPGFAAGVSWIHAWHGIVVRGWITEGGRAQS